MNKAFALLVLLVLLATLQADSLCSQCHQSFLRIDFTAVPGPSASGASPLVVTVHASFFNETVLSSPADSRQVGGLQSDNYQLAVVPATNAILRFTFDGQPLTDASGQPVCEGVLTTKLTALSPNGVLLEPGDASCAAGYAKNPDPAGPSALAISQWPHCGLLQASLLSSSDDSQVKPSTATAIYCPSNLHSLGLFNLFAANLTNLKFVSTCLPLFLVLGLLLASMYYQGRNPLSLFDITTPRLPNVKKVKMKSVTQPYHLPYKARMSNRIIGRAEASIGSQISRLYKLGGASAATIAAQRAAALALMPRQPNFTKAPAAHKTTDAMGKTISSLQSIVNRSGAKPAEQQRAMAAIRRMVEMRETLATDLAVTAAARSAGSGSKGLAKYNPRIEFVGQAIAKPINFVLERYLKVPKEKIDWIPGLPYVERSALVLTGWIGNRAGNIQMRRGLRRSLAAEVGKATGLLAADSKYYKNYSFTYKKIGEIPLIVERLRNEMHILGKAIIDEHLRAMAEAVYLQRTQEKGGPATLSIEEKGVQVLQDMIKRSIRDGQVNKVELARLLVEFLQAHKELQMRRPDGTLLKDEDRQKFLAGEKDKDSALYKIAAAYALLDKDDPKAAREAGLPDLKKPKVDPASAFNNYKKMLELLDSYNDEWKSGRVPLIMLGHDLSDIFGRAYAEAAKENAELLKHGDAARMAFIRLRMEEELSRKMLYDKMHGQLQGKDDLLFTKLVKGKYEAIRPFLDNGTLNPEWLTKLYGAVSPDKIRDDMNYSARGEWAARNYLTSHHAVNSPYAAEAERNRILFLRQLMAAQFDKGFENLFANYDQTVERNFLQYHALAGLASYYLRDLPADAVNRVNGQVVWDEKSYAAWKARGVLFADVQKGVWVVGGDKTLMPMPSRIEREDLLDAAGRPVLGKDGKPLPGGRITGAGTIDEKGQSMIDAQGRLTYDKTVFTVLLSDFSERPINGQFLFKTGEQWRPGAPTDRDIMPLSNQLKSAQMELNLSKYGKGSPAELMAEEERLRENMARVQDMLGERMRLVTRASLLDKDLRIDGREVVVAPATRAIWRASQFVERVGRGGVQNVDLRVQEWYASQAYARLVLDTFKTEWKKQDEKGDYLFLSKEVSDSLIAKEQLAQYRQEQINLLKQGRLSATQQARLNELRSIDLPEQLRLVSELETKARLANQGNFWADRDLKRVGEMATPFFNVAELTVMRDPRFAFGGGFGMGPAVMVGYQTGQFVGERPQMWAGYHLGPGDRVLNVMAKPAYGAAMLFGMGTRSFFTKMTGYTTIYHMDPERGPGSHHEAGVISAFQSLFRPSASMDWFTRLYLRPMVRTKYKDEFGTNVKDEGRWAGEHFVSPVSWKSAAPDQPFVADYERYRLMGLDADNVLRQRKLGLTFREEYTLWDKRFGALAGKGAEDSIAALRAQLNASADSAERRIIQSQIREIEDTAQTERKVWHIPGIGAFFRQGYYSVENRSGYDISAAGGAHRPYEMSNTWFKNTGRVNFPGMFFQDWEGGGSAPHLQLFPRVARLIASSKMPGTVWDDQYNIHGVKNSGTTLSDLVERISAEGNLNEGGVGRDINREAMRDVFKHDTPFLSKFLELETERMSYSFSNSPYIIPLAPLYVMAYQFLRKSSWGRRQPWTTETPRERDLGPLNADETRREQLMHQSMQAATLANQKYYSCPTHGLQLPLGSMCPLCRTKEEYERDTGTRGQKMARYKEMAVNWAQSAIPFTGYAHYYNQAHCPHHGIAYDRGSTCPICLQDKVRRDGYSAEKAKDFLRDMGDYNQQLREAAKDRSLSPEVRAKKMEDILQKREARAEELKLAEGRDKRMGYEESKEYLKAQMAEIRGMEQKMGWGYKKAG